MNAAKEVERLVNRGLELVSRIKSASEEMKIVNAMLAELALAGEQVPLEDPERDGRQFLARGTEHVVPVIITADALIGEFQAHTPKHDAIRRAATDAFLPQFYREVTKFERAIDSGKKFRAHALDLLGAEAGARLITACVSKDKNGIAKNAIKIEWDRAKEVPA